MLLFSFRSSSDVPNCPDLKHKKALDSRGPFMYRQLWQGKTNPEQEQERSCAGGM